MEVKEILFFKYNTDHSESREMSEMDPAKIKFGSFDRSE